MSLAIAGHPTTHDVILEFEGKDITPFEYVKMAEVRLFKTTTFRDRNVIASKTYIVFEQLITAEGNGSV